MPPHLALILQPLPMPTRTITQQLMFKPRNPRLQRPNMRGMCSIACRHCAAQLGEKCGVLRFKVGDAGFHRFELFAFALTAEEGGGAVLDETGFAFGHASHVRRDEVCGDGGRC